MAGEAQRAHSGRSYRWVVAWLIVGAVLALLLLANSVRDYLFVSRLLISQQVRHKTALRIAAFESELRNHWKPGDARLPLLMKELAADHPFWVQMRDVDGKVFESFGDPPARSFTQTEEASHFQLHEPLFKTVATKDGDAVVEAFAVHLPGLVQVPPPPAIKADLPPPGPRAILVVETALPLVASDSAVLAPQRTNLIINSAGAIALLATVLIAGLGFRSYARGKRLEEQLAIAHEVQSALLPKLLGNSAGVQLATEYRPAEEVGGDFFDVFPVNGGGLALVLGDVSGKGVPAALIVGVIHGAVRSSGWTQSAAQHELETAGLNRLLCEHASSERYASMCWCYYDAAARRLHYVNAGHCPPLLLGPQPSSPLALGDGGPVIGLLPGASYVQSSCEVGAGDVLVMYSDGVIEATNAAGEEYGEERLRALLAETRAGEPEAIRARIVASVQAFTGGEPLHDDLTLLVAKFGATA